MNLVQIIAPHFVAAFETDGIVRRAAPIIGYMVGWDDARARDYIAAKGWRARIVQLSRISDTRKLHSEPDLDAPLPTGRDQCHD